MKSIGKSVMILMSALLLVTWSVYNPSMAMAQKSDAKQNKVTKGSLVETWSKPNAKFDAGKMGDMSGFDLLNGSIPKEIRLKLPSSGPIPAPAL